MRKRSIWWCPCVLDFRQSVTAKNLHPSIKKIYKCKIMFVLLLHTTYIFLDSLLDWWHDDFYDSVSISTRAWLLVGSIFFVCCLLGDKSGIYAHCMWLYLLLCTRQQTVPGEGRKVVQEGCSCVNGALCSPHHCGSCLDWLFLWLEVHEVLVKNRTKCTCFVC